MSTDRETLYYNRACIAEQKIAALAAELERVRGERTAATNLICKLYPKIKDEIDNLLTVSAKLAAAEATAKEYQVSWESKVQLLKENDALHEQMARLLNILGEAALICDSAYCVPEWLQYGRTTRTDDAIEAINAVLAEAQKQPSGIQPREPSR